MAAKENDRMDRWEFYVCSYPVPSSSRIVVPQEAQTLSYSLLTIWDSSSVIRSVTGFQIEFF